ncbi:hypothetical protein AB0B28_08175 [Glycomyces sp. NPDC046736]|uniref:hypothetical protein n=1 Tax=Glycomyces sp. NPDC046736 TaxID=3155615 RepID=UPI0033F5F734
MTKPDDNQPPTQPPATDPPAAPPAPQPPVTDPAGDGDGTDWKAEARKWEKLAKDNKNATEKLAKLEAAAMSDQEKAVAAAKADGLAEAAKTYGSRLAAAELKAAAAAKGVDLSAIGDLIDSSKFVGADGEVDSTAIKSAVDKLAKTFTGPKRSGGDFNGGNGAGQITREQLAQMSPKDIAKAHAEGKLSHLM